MVICVSRDCMKTTYCLVLSILYFGSLMHTDIHDISYLYLGLLSYLPFCSSKFVNKEVENSNEMLIKSVRELKRFPHLDGGFTSQYAPVGWEFAKICNDVKSNPHLGPGWGGGVGVSIDKCIIPNEQSTFSSQARRHNTFPLNQLSLAFTARSPIIFLRKSDLINLRANTIRINIRPKHL